MSSNGLHSCRPKGHQVARLTTAHPGVAADIDAPHWQGIPWTSPFVTMDDVHEDSDCTAALNTSVAMCYDDRFLYVIAEISSPASWPVTATNDYPAACTRPTETNDEHFGMDPDSESLFQIFIDPLGSTHNYVEINVNALNVACARRMQKPILDGGGECSARVAAEGEELWWHMPLLQTATKVTRGAVNTNEATTWCVEAAIAFKDLEAPPSARPFRMNFARHERGGELILSWTPQYVWQNSQFVGVRDMHEPNCWGYIGFDGFEEEECEEEVHFLKQAAMQIYALWREGGEAPIDKLIKDKKLPSELKVLDICVDKSFSCSF
eukprot:GEMP01034033.1.p1 GENE.GEMP01034033.1~~GEMP01034033.1.p1  ORF type:complete len:323 (+),score=87.81 GEMP01034033.1:90-1058(+)